MKRKSMMLALMVCIAVILSLVSASTAAVTSQPLNLGGELQAAGGVNCAGLLGFTTAIGLGTLTPCSIICAVSAWYLVGVIAVTC